MADDYSKQNPYGKPPKNETLAQKHQRVAKFYSYQKKADQQAAAKGDVTAMDQLAQISRKASAGGKQREGASLQREAAERKLGINSPQARAQDQANRPGGFNARAMQGGVGAMLGEGAGGAAEGAIAKLLARARGGGMGQAAGQAARPMQQALPRPGLPTRPVPQQMQRPPMQGPPGGMQRPQLPQQPMPQRPGMPPQGPPQMPQRALPAPVRPVPQVAVRKSLSPKGPQGKTGEMARQAKDIAQKVQKTKSNPKSTAGRSVTRIKVKGEPGVSVGSSRNKISTGNVPKGASSKLSSVKGKSTKASQRSGESTKSRAGGSTKTAAKKTSTPMKRPSKKKTAGK